MKKLEPIKVFSSIFERLGSCLRYKKKKTQGQATSPKDCLNVTSMEGEGLKKKVKAKKRWWLRLKSSLDLKK